MGLILHLIQVSFLQMRETILRVKAESMVTILKQHFHSVKTVLGIAVEIELA